MKQQFTSFLLLALWSIFSLNAQIFEYIGTDEGLSSQRVLSIQQDKQGFIWILSHKGVDRYNGKNFTHYPLKKEGYSVNLYPNLNYLKTDRQQTVWEIGKDGLVFQYNIMRDSFQLEFDLKKTYPELGKTPISVTYMDHQDNILFCAKNTLYIYNPKEKKHYSTHTQHIGFISNITQGEGNQFYFASEKGLFSACLNNFHLENIVPIDLGMKYRIDYIYYHAPSQRILINTLPKNMLLYDCKSHDIIGLNNAMTDIGVNNIIPNRKDSMEVLIATDGDGVYKLNLKNNHLSHFLKEDTHNLNKMNGSIIKDIYMDKANRIWNVIYPTGITIYSENYPAYFHIMHSANNPNSLVHNFVNGIIEDSDGDTWYATSNGISHYDFKRNKWNNYLNNTKYQSQKQNTIFTALCEYKPGYILAGGYMSGVYLIEKKTGKTTFFTQKSSENKEGDNKYIRSIFKDCEGNIWSGGFYKLRLHNTQTNISSSFNTEYPITHIAQKDSNTLWIGTINGVYMFDSKQKKTLPFESEIGCVNMIYSPIDAPIAYFATYGNGLFAINKKTGETRRFYTENSGLLSNNIYSIVKGKGNCLYISTENGITRIDLKEMKFSSWTKGQGLQTANFNAKAAVHTCKGRLIFGSNEGIVILPDSISFPQKFNSKMYLSNLDIMYHRVYPGDKNSPLTVPLNETPSIKLKYNQNTFSLKVSSINFDNASNILYSWKLEGFYDQWNKPSNSEIIRYTNLSPGKYYLRIRAIHAENLHIIEERSLYIYIEQPYWFTVWAFLLYAILASVVIYMLMRYNQIRRDRKASIDKINFFMHTAHDIRTPLTLIKAPLGEIMKNEQLSEEGLTNLNLAIQSTEDLSVLADNLINFQKEELYGSNINVTKHELNAYLQTYIQQFMNYAQQKGIQLRYKSQGNKVEVWIDQNKVNAILRNLLSNALNYTPEGGCVDLEMSYNKNRWFLTISDTGIGIPKKEQKKLFKFLFRASNATGQSISGSGIGMLLTYRLIKKHGGKISFKSTENVGTSFRLDFPIRSKKYHYQTKEPNNEIATSVLYQENITAEKPLTEQQQTNKLLKDAPIILLVEDNNNLRAFLNKCLAEHYRIMEATNGQEALHKIKQQQPDLIISDVMMPLMDGEEMCHILKSDIETSHIPVILLTALGSRREILRGLEMKADMYIVKPFDLMVLKANISNILENRELLRQKFQKLPLENHKQEPTVKATMPSNLDNEFMEKVTQLVKEGLGKEFNVDILCSQMNMSRTSFYNKIKALTGVAPADFIRTVRMQEAATLLKSKQYTVSEVADMLGFADPKYFTDSFKKYYGMPPSSYMKQQK